jgi:hypothetical protein
MESRDILKVNDPLKDPTKMFKTCWLLGRPTTRKPGLKNYDLSKSKKNRVLHSAIKTSRYEAMFGTVQRIKLADSRLTEDMYLSIETEEELEQLFNAGINNGRDKEEANQQDRKDKDENETNKISEETVKKKHDKILLYDL